MSRQPRGPIWPFMFVLLCLFVLAVTAPRGWERIARKTLAPELVALGATGPDAAGPHAQPASRKNARQRPAAAPQSNEPIATDLADADLARADLVAADGPHLAEIVEPVLAEPREKIAGSRAEQPPASSTLNFESTALDAASADAASAESSTKENSPPSFVPLDPPSVAVPPSNSSLPKPSPAASPIALTSNGPPATELRLSARPTRPLQTPDVRMPEVEDDATGSDAATSDSAAPDIAPAVRTNRWTPPVDLLRRLESLAQASECSQWALRAGDLVRELTAPAPPAAPRAKEIVGELRGMAGSAEALLVTIQQRDVAIELMRVRHALSRRVDVWELLPALQAADESAAEAARRDPTRLSMCLAHVAELTREGGSEGSRWRNYLMFDTLESVAQAGRRGSEVEARDLAQRVLRRLSRGGLTSSQRDFLTSGPLEQLGEELRGWAAEPVDAGQLLADLERFEQTGLPSDARRLAEHRRRLSWLAKGEAGTLAERLDTNYRNANLRVAISERFLDRLVPKSHTATMPVNDRVLGYPVRGTSTASTTLDVRLVPDPHRLRLALEANGKIDASTSSTSGPATVYNQSESHYFAQKMMEIDLGGIHAAPTETDSDTTSRLRGVRTNFDGIPVLGALVENIVRSRHAEKKAEAGREVRRKIADSAQRQIDAETDPRVEAANQQLRERVLAPLARLELQPSVIEMETSPQRLTMRLRLAAEEQLAGNTPRPQAPGDSLVSLQLHQSLLNNVCERLRLNGRTFTVPELREYLDDLFDRPTVTVSDSPGDDVRLSFAAEDAVHVQCEDGRIKLTLSFARLSAESQSWANFAARVYFRPQVDGLAVRLVRDGVIQLSGRRLNAKGQVVVRGIFNRTFPKDRTFDLVDAKWSTDKRLADLRISQFLVQDGWIGVAVGPDTAATRQSVARKP
jgi:hypothetical protein